MKMRSKRRKNKQKARHRNKVAARRASIVKVWLHGAGVDRTFVV